MFIEPHELERLQGADTGRFIGDTYAIRDSGTECLNEFPPELIQIS